MCGLPITLQPRRNEEIDVAGIHLDIAKAIYVNLKNVKIEMAHNYV